MERIKQAIEKSLEQNAPATARRGPVPPVIDSAPAGYTDAAGSTGAADIGVVAYKETRVVKLDPVRLERNRILAHNKNAPMGGVIDLLRTQVMLKMEERGWRTLAITSPSPESGKTMVSINLAMSIAMLTTKSVLLIDFDLRRPRVGSYLGLTMQKSMNELLSGSAQLSEVMVNPNIPRLVILPTRQPVPHSSEVLSSPKVSSLIEEVRQRYDSRIVIFDLPPILSTDDAIVLLPKVDCVLLVVANGVSSKKEIEESLHHIPEDKLLGTVFNKAEEAAKRYYY